MQNDTINMGFTDVLKGALALPDEDKRRLTEVMLRVTSPAAVSTPLVLTAAEAPAPDGTAEVRAAEWLQKIRGEPAWAQLQLLEAALESTDDPSELQVLQGAHNTLLQDNPPIAVRRAVVRTASEHPVGILVGAAGLLLAVVALASRLFHLVF